MYASLSHRNRAAKPFLSVNRSPVPASFPVVLGDFGCDVTSQACRENSPETHRAIALGSKPPLVTQIARTSLGTRPALYGTIFSTDRRNAFST